MVKTEAVSKPVPLIIDASGKTVDASGQEIQLINLVPSLKANLRAQEKKTEYVKVSKSSSDISWGSVRQLGQL
jgi:U4/U6 small nuclear ribonucleoprotein PRP3